MPVPVCAVFRLGDDGVTLTGQLARAARLLARWAWRSRQS